MKKLLSFILCLSMLLSLFPVSAFAEEEEQAEPQMEQEELLEEVEEEQEPDTIVETLEEHTHAYSAVVTEPTCTERGYTTYVCDCGDSYVADYTDALGHTPENVAEAIRSLHPWGVDLSSGVETDRMKDPTKMAAAVAAVRSCNG